MNPYSRRERADTGLSAVGLLASALVNVGLFAGMAWASNSKSEKVEPPALDVIWAEVIPKKGVEPEQKNALPRIVKSTPPPPPPAEDAIKTGQREEELKKKKAEEEEKKRIAAEEARQERLERERKKEEERERRRKERAEKRARDRAMSNAFDNLEDDPRAEDAPGVGRKDGLEGGNSTSGQITEKQRYIALVNQRVGRLLKIPPIPREDRNKVVKVKFSVNSKGKTSNPKILQSSGNSACDSAYIAAVRRFGEDAPASLPLPEQDWLKKDVLSKGMVIIQKCGGGS